MTDPRDLFGRAVPEPAELDLDAVTARAAVLTRRRRAAVGVACAAVIVAAAGGTSMLLAPDPEVLVPAAPSASPEPSAAPSAPAPSESAEPACLTEQERQGAPPVDPRAVVVYFTCADAPVGPGDVPTSWHQRPVPEGAGTTADLLRVALSAYLDGPSADEARRGYRAAVDATYVRPRDIAVADGTAVLDLAGRLPSSAGTSTYSRVLVSELADLALQFLVVDRLEIRLNGSCEDFYAALEIGECRVIERGGDLAGFEPGTDDCSGEAGVRTYEATAQCLYDAFLAEDRERAADYASEDAVELMFSLGGFPSDDQWRFEGCGRPRETQPSSGISCRYSIPGEVHGTTVEMAMARDRTVESIAALG